MQQTHLMSAGALPLLCASVLLTEIAEGQQSAAQVAVSAGVATDQRGVRANALTIAPALSFVPSAHSAFQLGASVTRFDTQAWSLGASASFSGRDPLGGFGALTLNASATGARLQAAAPASFAQADLVPALELRWRAVTVFGGGRAATGLASERMRQTGVPFPGGGTNSVSTTRTGFGPLFGAAVALDLQNGARLQLGAREDRLRVADNDVLDRAVTATLTAGAISIGGSAGTRRADDERGSFGALGASLALSSVSSLELAVGRYPSNRLLATPGGEYASVGLAWRFGGPRDVAAPTVRGAPPPVRGSTRLAIRAPQARSVEVAGDFSDWKLVAAKRAADGVWYADLTIPAGQYRYAFRVNGVEWRVPDGATAVEDEFGGKSAWLTVGDAEPRN